MSKFHRNLCVLFSRTCAGLYIYHLFVWSNLNFLHNSQWITLPTLSCLVLYSFCANLLHFPFFRFFFLTRASTDGFSLEFEWWQVSSYPQDPPKYSGRFQQCWSLDGFYSSSYFQYQSFGDSHVHVFWGYIAC